MIVSKNYAFIILVAGAAIFGSAGACSDRFGACKENRTCKLPVGGESSGGAAPNIDDATSGATDVAGGNEARGGASDVGNEPGEPLAGGDSSGGAPTIELLPPEGAFAWYKATEDDVTLVSATLADGNEFIKSSWIKTNLTTEALQPDVDGGNTATALYAVATGERSLRHPIASTSYASLKTLKIRAKMGESRYLWVGGSVLSPQPQQYAVFDLLDGLAFPAGGARSAGIEPLKNLWYSCEVTLLSGAEVWVATSSSPIHKELSGPTTAKPLAWIQGAEVLQTWVTSWKDRVGANDFIDPAGRWGWLAAAADLRGLPALQADYLYGPTLATELPAEWSFLHDGSGATLVALQRQSGPSKAYKNSLQTVHDDAHEGMHLGVSGSDANVWAYSVTNANAEALFALDGGSTTGIKWLAASYTAQQTPNAQLFEDGLLVASANAMAPPSPTAGNEPLSLGGPFGPSQLVHEVIVYDRVLDSGEIARLKAYFAEQLGE
jgi:hypothetical protein